MLSKFVIGGVALLAIVSSLVGTNLNLETAKSSSPIAIESLFSESDRKSGQVLTTYEKLTKSWQSYQKETKNRWNPTILYSALEYASEKYTGQTRTDLAQTPYIVHPMGVEKILWEEGNVRDIEILIAALLHDTLEDTDATEAEIEGMFGARVLSIIKELSTENASLLSKEAKLIKLAERLYNIRDLQAAAPINWSQEDVDRYFSSGEQLLEAVAGTDAQLEDALKWELSHPKSKKSEVISKSLVLG